MKRLILILLLSLFICSCASKGDVSPSIMSMQIVDRNGFSETISTKDRIAKYQNTNFLGAQPYQKVLRVYKKDEENKTPSVMTTYHGNGLIWQYLEIVDGRAQGTYKEWYPSGTLKMQMRVIEGYADLKEEAQRTWVFDGLCTVYDEAGRVQAEIFYEKGMLHTPSLYYHPEGGLAKIIPYNQNLIDGDVIIYDRNGAIIEKIPFCKGKEDKEAIGYWDDGTMRYQEHYQEGKLSSGIYFTPQSEPIAGVRSGCGFKAVFDGYHLQSLIEYRSGDAQGRVDLFAASGLRESYYHQKEGKKEGEELLYYLGSTHPKLMLHWHEDMLEGQSQTWYEGGALESQREYHQNKKHGTSLAWYKNGDVMMMEEYDHSMLISGTYFKKGDKKPISKVENGKGIATLYNGDGVLLKKIHYDKGQPLLDPPIP